MDYWLAFATGYFIGSIPWGWLLVKIFTGEDVREIGSGSTGARNVGRALGLWAFFATYVLDILKGFLPMLLVITHWPEQDVLHILTAAGLALGHSKSLYLGFTGGKSVAVLTGAGFALCLADSAVTVIIAVAYLSFALGYCFWGNVSGGSVTSAIAVGLVALGLYYLDYLSDWYGIGSLLLCLFICVTHFKNIKRLLKGTEPIDWKRSFMGRFRGKPSPV